MQRRIARRTLQRASTWFLGAGLVDMASVGTWAAVIPFTPTVGHALNAILLFLAGAATAVPAAVVMLICAAKDSTGETAFWAGMLMQQARDADTTQTTGLRIVPQANNGP